MKRYGVFTLVLLFLTGSAIFAQKSETQRKFVGVKKCKTCHRKAEQGEQYKIWMDGPHAKAFDTLAGEEALKIGKEKGIENPQTSEKCLKCHVTAFGVDAAFLGTKYDMKDGVGCESCHGAGGDYYKKKTMKAITAGKTDPASVGLVLPDEKVCVSCHNDKSPSFKGFDFKEASKKIAHPIPDEVKEKLKSSNNENEPENEEEDK